MSPVRFISILAVLLCSLSVASGQKVTTYEEKSKAVEDLGSSLKSSAALAERFEGKLSPRLLELVAENPSTLRVLVLLHEPEPRQGASVDVSSPSDLAAYMAAAERVIQGVISSVPSPELKVRNRYRTITGFSAEVTLSGLEQLTHNPKVKIVNPVLRRKRLRVEGGSLMQVPAVHARGVRGAGVTAAVIDDGIDYRHAELGASPNTGTAFFPNSVVIDGFDFGFGVAEPSPVGESSHGTSVAGIIAGRGTDSRGGRGVAPEAKLVGLRIADTADDLDNDLIIASLDWLVANNARINPRVRIVNMSLGGGPYVSGNCNGIPDVGVEEQAIARVASAGMIIVAAAGNEGVALLATPACFSQVISVGAVYDADIGPQIGFSVGIGGQTSTCNNTTTRADLPTCYSNLSNAMTVWAPSHNAHSPRAGGAGGGYDETFGGTSAAAPYTSGAIALLLSRFPQLGFNEVKNLLQTNGPFIIDPGAPTIQKRRVDIDAMFRAMGDTGATPSGPCVTGTTTLCLQNSRYEVKTQATFNNATHPGHQTKVSDQFGYFSVPGFTGDPTNIEIFIKITGQVPPTNKNWIFFGSISGFTVDIDVRDTVTGKTKRYTIPGGSYKGDGRFEDFP